jgi:hypothetical protein
MRGGDVTDLEMQARVCKCRPKVLGRDGAIGVMDWPYLSFQLLPTKFLFATQPGEPQSFKRRASTTPSRGNKIEIYVSDLRYFVFINVHRNAELYASRQGGNGEEVKWVADAICRWYGSHLDVEGLEHVG